MSGAITGSALALAGAAAAGGALLAKSMAKTPNIPAPQAPTPPPQMAKAPSQTATRQNAASATGPITPTGTLLTGSGGVNPTALLLGSNTLLGQ